MKNYFLLALLLLVSRLSAQIVNIPDANFKNKLIALGVDTNNDGEIQNIEAEAVTYLWISSSGIADLTGIEGFVNLDSLDCSDNQLSSLDISNCVNLKWIGCSINPLTYLNINNPNLLSLSVGNTPLTTIDVSTCTNLQYLSCEYNQLTSLDVSGLLFLQTLFCGNNQLTNLAVNGCVNLSNLYCPNNAISNLVLNTCTNLQRLNCSQNQIVNLTITGLQGIEKLYCFQNLITSLDVSLLTNLTDFRCYANQLSVLNVANLTNLLHLQCHANSLTSLDVNTLTNLEDFSCGGNLLSSLDVSNLTNLTYLNCSSANLTHLDVSTCVNLVSLYCTNNQLQTLDVNNLTHLQYLGCNNNQLITLFAKNGMSGSIGFNNNPNLQYICVDVDRIALVQQHAILFGMPNVSINSFCSFPPGGNGNTVSGKSIYDADANGCTISDSAYSYLQIALSNGVDTIYGYTNSVGNYTVFVDTGTSTFTPQIENPAYFSASPNVANVYFANSNNVQIQDFCITPNGIFPDVEIVLSPLNNARPGFDAEYQLLFNNKGTTTVSGDITVDFMGNKMTFVSASQACIAQTANQLTWNYSNLQPFESRNITFTMNLLPPPTNNIGDILNFSASIPLINDADGYDNFFTFAQNVVGSYDPNDKTCLEGNHLLNSKIGDYLHYLIRFQNTGNYPADHVVIVDSINVNQFDIASLQILETSHNAHITVNQGVLQFYFENIQLADSFSNEPESHGYVLFKIKTKANLPQNSSVANKAEIYFDYNLPIITNTEITTFADIVSLANGIQKPHFQLYPNPAQNSLTIETEKPADFVIVNVMGEMLISKHIEGKQTLDISLLPKGIYFIQEKNTHLGQLFMRN